MAYANFSNQFVQNALKPTPAPVGQTMSGFSPSNFINQFVNRTPQVSSISTQPSPTGGTRPGGYTPDGSYSVGYNGSGSGVSSGPSTLDLIRSRLDETRRLAREKVSNAASERDYLLNYLKDQYGTLQNRAKERLGTSLETLNQEGTGLSNLYEKSRGNQRRRTANNEVANRQRARALNRLDSSFYDDIQAENSADLTRSLGTLDTEESAKQSALGTRKTETNQYFTNIGQDLDREQADQEHRAQSEYQRALQEADALDRAGVLDYGEGVAQAQQALESRLDSIAQAADNMRLQRTQIAGQLAAQGGNINSFNAIDSQLQNTLGNNSGLEAVLARILPQLGIAQNTGPETANLLSLTRRPDDRLLM